MATKIQKIIDASNAIEGWLRDSERDLLLEVAMGAARDYGTDYHAWVEVGSYQGKSTVLLAWALKDAKANAMVFAIDPHEGEVSTPPYVNNKGQLVIDETHFEAPTYEAFMANMQAHKVQDFVEAVTTKVADLDWNGGPIDLVFFDGLHHYEAIRSDYEHLRPFFAPHAILLFHDSDWQGVADLIAEKVDDGEIQIVQQVESLTVALFPGKN